MLDTFMQPIIEEKKKKTLAFSHTRLFGCLLIFYFNALGWKKEKKYW